MIKSIGYIPKGVRHSHGIEFLIILRNVFLKMAIVEETKANNLPPPKKRRKNKKKRKSVFYTVPPKEYFLALSLVFLFWGGGGLLVFCPFSIVIHSEILKPVY